MFTKKENIKQDLYVVFAIWCLMSWIMYWLWLIVKFVLFLIKITC